MDSAVMDVRLRSWIPVLEAQADSGLSKKAFCEQNNISENTFYRWQRYLRQKLLEGYDPYENQTDIQESRPEPTFVELPLTPSEQNSVSVPRKIAPKKTSSMTLTFHGVSIKIEGAVDEDALAAVLRAVKHA